MITIRDWERACEEDRPLYYADGGGIVEVFRGAPIKYDFTQNSFFVIPLNIWFKNIYKSKKECARFLINTLREQYMGEPNE